jgi:two-component system chemotaxis response regulator CheY
MKVLIADDSSFMRTVIKNYLKDFQDLVIVEAADGEEALEKFRSEKPDLVLLDIIMPKVNGLEVLRELKKEKRVFKVVIITSVGQSSVVEEAMALGAAKYITKPFRYEDIVEIINEFS